MEVLTRVKNSFFGGGGTAPLKFERAKNFQNSAWFRTTFEFDGKCLSNKLRYRQVVNGVINYHFFRVEKKNLVNFGLWTTKLCLLISTYPTSTVRALSDNFRIWSHLSRELEISINAKPRLQPRSIQRWMPKNWRICVHKQQSSVVSFRTMHQSLTLRLLYMYL